MNLGREIINVLLNHPTVYVEGLGQFSRIYISAKHEAKEGVYLPPVTYIEFDPYGTDGLNFIQYLQKAKDVEHSQLQEQVKHVVSDLKEKVSHEGSAFINHLGHLFPHGESFVFKPLDLSGFDFEKVPEIEPLKKQGEAVPSSTDPSDPDEKEEGNEEKIEAPYHSEERIGDLHDPRFDSTDMEDREELLENEKEDGEDAPYRSEERIENLQGAISGQPAGDEAEEERKEQSDTDSFHAIIQSEEGQIRDPVVFTRNEEVSEGPKQESNTETESEALKAQSQGLDFQENSFPEEGEASEEIETEEVREELKDETPALVTEELNPKRKSTVWYVVGGVLLLGLLAFGYFMYLQGDLKGERLQEKEISQAEILEERPVAEPVHEDLKEENQQAEMEGIEEEEETVEREETFADDKHQIVIGAHKSIQDAEEQRNGFLEKGISTVRIVSRDREGPAQHMVIWDSFEEREKADSVLRIVRSKYVRDAWRKDL